LKGIKIVLKHMDSFMKNRWIYSCRIQKLFGLQLYSDIPTYFFK